jgi:predicted phage tail protein
MILSGAKGGSSSFKQTPDNLRSIDTFEGVLGVCIGPVKGPTNGLKSIKLDGTAIENDSGDLNYGDFVAQLGDGDPAKFPQIITLKMGTGAAPMQIGLTLSNPNGPNDSSGNPTPPTGPGPWVTRTLANTGAQFIDLRFIVEQLYRQDKKGIYEETLTIEVQLKPVGSATWINPTLTTPTGTYNEQGGTKADIVRTLIPRSYYDASGNWKPGNQNFAITGKTTSAAVYELRLSVPNEGAYANTAWDLRCRLIERETYTGGDDGEDQEKRTVQWESAAAVYGNTMGSQEDWRGLSWLQLYGKASDQLTGVPEITGEWDTKVVSVPPPTIYNPDTRQYTAGLWDGSWSKAFVNDPAWVINDAISDSLSGLSLIATGSYLNKWDALDLSKWCSTLVPDGKGGMEPRYSINIAISQPQKAEDFIRYLAGGVGALVWDQGDGEWRCKVDKPDNPVDIFTLDNIIDEFVYSHTDVDTRFNDIIGQFLNAEMDYRQDAVRLFDSPSIANIGRKPTTIALVGCTGRQEALRRVKLRLRSTVNETKIVNFTTNRRGRNVEPLSTILIADGDLGDSDKRTTGRMIAISADRKTITVRDPLRLEVGVDYTMKFAMPNAAYTPEAPTQPTSIDWTKPTLVVSRNITNSSSQRGNVKIIYLDTALPTDVDENLTIALEATNLVTLPRLFRVTGVSPQDDGEKIAISAINIDTGKYDAADNVTNDDTVFQDLRGAVPMPLLPESGTVLTQISTPSDTGVITTLMAQWQRPPGAYISGFRVQHSINGGALNTVIEKTQLPIWELVNAAPGAHHVEICTISRGGLYSEPLKADFTVAFGPDQTRPSMGQIWRDGAALDPGHSYSKGELAVDQGATWIYTSDLPWDGTPPPTLPSEENDFWRQVKNPNTTSISVDNASFSINADSSGNAMPGQLPVSGKATLVVANSDVSATTTWTLAATNCTATINSGGVFQITATGSGVSGWIDITGTYNGVAQKKRVTINKNITGGAGGGSGSSSSVSAFPSSVVSTSYASSPTATSSVTASSGGNATFNADITFNTPSVSSGTSTCTLYGKIVYRLVGGTSWTDAGPETICDTTATSTGYPSPGTTAGHLGIANTTVSGLTAGSNYEYGILLRIAAGASATSLYGAVNASGTP